MSSPCLKATFTQLTALPLARPTLLPWRWQTKGKEEASSLLADPISWQHQQLPVVAPAGWLGLNVDSGGCCQWWWTQSLLLLVASNGEHPTGAGRPPHFHNFFREQIQNTNIQLQQQIKIQDCTQFAYNREHPQELIGLHTLKKMKEQIQIQMHINKYRNAQIQDWPPAEKSPLQCTGVGLDASKYIIQEEENLLMKQIGFVFFSLQLFNLK